MSALTADRFAEFYKAVHGKVDDPKFGPFPWQERLARRVCVGDWPQVIALPTAAGKTTCIDIAVFALACQSGLGSKRTAPRRVFFVVDRRVVVDQACLHAKKLAKVLTAAEGGILRDVAVALRDLAVPGWLELKPDEQKSVRPLDVYCLRGGMYRETAWARTPLQPTVIASTVDQVGSRLLFRGYGVSDGAKPIHAGLVGNDALILLDEAHCARPFAQTVEAIARYRRWQDDGAPRPPFAFVTMTATPGAEVTEAERARERERPDDPPLIERDQEDDRDHRVLGDRIKASKPTKLVVAQKATGKKGQAELVKELVNQARGLAEQGFGAVGILVNRVATARMVARELDAVLLTGRMRPVDRDLVFKERLQPLLSNAEGVPPQFVVGTQCLEVGADFDFHALVTECASLDALRQRFGRLNRVAVRQAARGVVVIRGDETDDTTDDPVYRASLAETWKWLRGDVGREEVDFGIAAMRSLCADLSDDDYRRLNAPVKDAPVLLPAHLDCWVQTSPVPVPDPDPAVFLHGPESGEPDVQVVLRADLGDDPKLWRDVVALCPPSSSEALPVRIGLFRRWLVETNPTDQTGDIEGERGDSDEAAEKVIRPVLKWKGPQSPGTALLTDPTDPSAIRPGDTFVVSTATSDLGRLGDFPTWPPADHGDEAFQRSRDRAILRLTPAVIATWPAPVQRGMAAALGMAVPEDTAQPPEPGSWSVGLSELAELEEGSEDFESRLSEAMAAITAGPEWLTGAAARLRSQSSRAVEPHPAGGFVVTGRRRMKMFDPAFLEDDDTSSGSPAGRGITLEDHCLGVADTAHQFGSGCGLPGELVDRFTIAGRWHDAGKADPRFQAMLQGRSPHTVRRPLLAKSERAVSPQGRELERAVHQYPKGGRHELLSAALAEARTSDDLLLHLIATHHGFARPLAPAVVDGLRDQSAPFTVLLLRESFQIASARQSPAEWNRTLPERFWRVVRRYGWWGAAYLEAIFRLADHEQSRAEQEENESQVREVTTNWIAPGAEQRPTEVRVELAGLDGSNPLAFLAALGALRTLAGMAAEPDRPNWLGNGVRLAWGTDGAPTTAALHLAGRAEPEEIGALLADRLVRDFEAHPASFAAALLGAEDSAERLRDLAGQIGPDWRERLDWLAALYSDLAPDAASQLQMVRRDYLLGNLRSVLRLTTAEHIIRSLFVQWDYGDPLDNQSLHWDPSEDRRYAYQWNQPNGDRTRKRRGGMLGANRLAVEAWPLFPSVGKDERLSTRGFSGNKSTSTFWTWPVWSQPLTVDSVSSILALPDLQEPEPDTVALWAYGIRYVYRSQRILVGKTPNLTPAYAM